MVEQLTLIHDDRSLSSERHNEVGRTRWRELLRPLGNLKTLHVQESLVSSLSQALQSDNGESALEILPNLKEVGYSGGDDSRDLFSRFIDEREVAGHPVTLIPLTRI